MARVNVQSGGPFEDVYGYCRAVRVGSQVHVAGTTPQPPNVEGCDAYQQATAALAIIQKALTDVGARPEDVVRTVTYVTDIGDALLVAKAHNEMFGDVRPAATLVEVSGLLGDEVKVEIEAYAIVVDD